MDTKPQEREAETSAMEKHNSLLCLPIKQVTLRGKWGTKRLWFDLHNAVGISSLLPLAILAATSTGSKIK